MASGRLVVRSISRTDEPVVAEASGVPGQYDLYVVRRRRVWHPPTDVYEVNGHIIVQVEIAGMREQDFRTSLLDRTLVISGVRCCQQGRTNYQNMEIHYGEFRSQVSIDFAVRESDVIATYEDGFLYVKFPMPRAHRVPVMATGSVAIDESCDA